ncbi:Cpr49Ab, partial [Drosophila busckii]
LILIISQFCLLICATVALAQRRVVRPVYSTGNAGDGQYRPSNDGQYRPDSSGSGNDGRYVHVDNKYKHDARLDGGYKGKNIPYVPHKEKFIPTPPTPRVRVAPTYKPAPPQAPAAVFVDLPQGKGRGVGKNGDLILRQNGAVDTVGFNYLYETENGILGEEAGKIEKQDSGESLRTKGFYEYTGDDGKLYHVDYVADNGGFIPVGAHIPTVPPHVPRLLEYL